MSSVAFQSVWGSGAANLREKNCACNCAALAACKHKQYADVPGPRCFFRNYLRKIREVSRARSIPVKLGAGAV